MANEFKILTILGSPHDGKSNTRALVEDFVEDVAAAGLAVDHQVISLGRKKVLPCKGCWNCTRNKPCPLSQKDDLEEIKATMIECDMLILASPVYTNQITAQMKALFDRLFTWCHIFPLLGKYSLSACTTGNDGHEEVSAFLEKMLATYGTYSFGTIRSVFGFTPGFFPGRERARRKNKKLAARVARTVLEGKKPRVNKMQRKMFKVMRRKMTGVHAINCKRRGNVDGQPEPPWLRLKIMDYFIEKLGFTEKQLDTWAGFLEYELGWWRSRGWLDVKSFSQLAAKPVPADFNVKQRLLAVNKITERQGRKQQSATAPARKPAPVGR
jgi:multimeric flavodoxin WrbA